MIDGADLLRRKLDVRKPQPLRRAEAVAGLAVPHTDDGRVGGEEERLAAGGLGAAHDALLQRAVAHRVQLHGVRDGGRRAPDVLDRVVGEAGDGHGDAAARAGAAGGQLAGGMGHGLDAGGRDAEREGEGAVPEAGARVAARDVDEDAREEAVFGVGAGVVVDGGFVGGARVVEFWGG